MEVTGDWEPRVLLTFIEETSIVEVFRLVEGRSEQDLSLIHI